MLTTLIINLLDRFECVCTVSTYNDVSIAGTKDENTVWGWGRVSMGRSATKSQGNIREFYISWRVDTLCTVSPEKKEKFTVLY